MGEWMFKRKLGYISTAICGAAVIVLITLWACGIGTLLLYLMAFPVAWAAINSYFYAKRAQDELNEISPKEPY